MKTNIYALCVLVLFLGVLGCDGDPQATPPRSEGPEVKKVPAGKNIILEVQDGKRRVLIQGHVCLREGQIEQFLTRKGTKEHEAIIAADVDARDVHKALLAAGAEPGSPVRFSPQYAPARGTVIKVSVQWEDRGRLRTELAQKWVLNGITKKNLAHDWVFGGSRFIKDQEGVLPDHYLANDGDVICVSNFEAALLDLPISSPNSDDDRAWIANTERIPPRDARVIVILEPVLESKKEK